MTDRSPAIRGPWVVAVGGGHGLATTLRAVRTYAGTITAVVSMADDGGSTGRLRRDYDVPAPGDLRKCLVVLAGPDERTWPEAFEHRFGPGDLEGHAFGNLVLAGLASTLGDFGRALEEAGRLLGAVGRVLPATTERVVLKAVVEDHEVKGQTAVQNAPGRIRGVELIPPDAPATPAAVAAIAAADQVILAPGSLYTSLLPVLCVKDLCAALVATPASVVQVCNLGPQLPETAGLDANDHLRAVLDHGGRADRFLVHAGGRLRLDEAAVRACAVLPVTADVARPGAPAHDPAKLAQALQALL